MIPPPRADAPAAAADNSADARETLAAQLGCWADLLEDAADQFAVLAGQVASAEVTNVYARERARFHLSTLIQAGPL